MKRFSVLIGCVYLLFLESCNDAGLYNTVNPPMDGVVIGGSGNQNISGFVRVSPDLTSPTCKSDLDCLLTISNKSFVTLKTLLPKNFLGSSSKLGIQISTSDSSDGLVYVYKQNGLYLERDNRNYTNGVFPHGEAYNLASLQNESFQEILVRGVFSLKKTIQKPENMILAYLSLKASVISGEKFSLCISTVDESAKTIQTFLEKPADCFTVVL